MTVFVAHAPADQETAEALEKVLERRGLFVELDDGQTALRPITSSDALVLLISNNLAFAPTRLRIEQRALDAWAQGGLVVVKLDQGLAPVGLRDLPAIDASLEAQREFKWNDVANAVREAQLPARQAPGGAGELATARPQAPPPARAAKKRGGGALGWILALLVLAAALALGAYALNLAVFVVRGPGGWAFPLPLVIAAAAAALALIVLLAMLLTRSRPPAAKQRRESAGEQAPPPPPQVGAPEASEPSGAMFVSYARANSTLVLPVIEAAQAAGRNFWLDQQGIGAGDGWAGEIVRAIRVAGGVLVMCSKDAFESDHVKREIYLADRYKKRLLPVYIEQAEAPEDFEYFFAGVQTLNLFETPEAERPQALMRVLGTA